MPGLLRRVAIVGPAGCGKTTLARTLSARIGAPHIELDALRYDSAWLKVPDEVFWHDVAEHAGTSRWVIDGNYENVRDIVWVRADLLVWLDYSLPVVMGRLVSRTVRRLLGREEFANQNRERLQRVLGRESILLWTIRSYRRRRLLYERLLAQPRYAHLDVVRLRTVAATDAWLAQILGCEPAGNALERDATAAILIEPAPPPGQERK